MGNGNIDVGSKNPTHEGSLRGDKAGHPCAQRAMSQQGSDSGRGTESVPQKLVQLVGYRDPNARPDPWIRPRSIPVKR